MRLLFITQKIHEKDDDLAFVKSNGIVMYSNPKTKTEIYKYGQMAQIMIQI